jgi:hypothetical protein
MHLFIQHTPNNNQKMCWIKVIGFGLEIKLTEGNSLVLLGSQLEFSTHFLVIVWRMLNK